LGGAQWIYVKNSLGAVDSNYNPVATIDQKGAYNIQTLVHEMGHNLGLGHAGTATQNGTTIPYVEYDDMYSIMGGGEIYYELPKLDSYFADWLKLPNSKVLSAPLGSASNTAVKLTLNATGSSTGNTSIKVTDQITNKDYYVEFRNGLLGTEPKTRYGSYENHLAESHAADSRYICFLPGIRISTDAREVPNHDPSLDDSRYFPNPTLTTIVQNFQDGGSYNPSFPCNMASQPVDQWFTVDGLFQLKFYPVDGNQNQIQVAIRPLNFPFNDISDDNMFKDDINWAYQNGITAGQPEYSPYGPVTRGQMAAFVYRLSAKPDRSDFTPQDTAKFIDSQSQHTVFYSDIAWMGKTGLSMPDCVSNCLYSPNSSVTRGQMAAFMYRLAGSPDLDGLNSTDYAKFVDSTPEKTVFYKEIAWMGKTGLSMPGCSVGCQYSPNDSVNRAQMAAFMRRFNSSFLNIEYY
jgi:hypothetical protein